MCESAILHTCRDLAAGFENKVPVLFLDLQDDLLTPCEDDPEGAVTTGSLFGEKAETMINLPIFNTNQQGVSGVCVCVCASLPLSALSRPCMQTPLVRLGRSPANGCEHPKMHRICTCHS